MLQLVQICKSFADKIVAHNITLTIPNGSITAILGASGSGKSTLLNIIAGLVKPDSGDILLDHVSQKQKQPENRHVAMMFQDFALLPHLNVWQNVAFGLRMRGINKNQARATAHHLLDEVALGQLAERRIDALSGGEKQRVALARALAGEPKILLLDEPFSSLDSTLRGQLQQLTRDLVRRRQIPALLVTHDPHEACLMADELALFARGEWLQTGTPDAILSHPKTAQVARLLGCLNVSDTHYVPQHAIHLHDARGVECTVLSCHQQPEHWRLLVQHPIFCVLTCLAEKNVCESTCRVWVDDQCVITFIVV